MSNPENPQSLMAAMRHFDPDGAETYIASIKWPDGPHCPKCGSVNVGQIKSRRRYQCCEKGCRKQFSLTTGTILEGTHLRLDQWVVAVWMIVGCRNGVSSCEIARTIDCKQQSAWHLLHRVRHILAQDRTGMLGEHGAVVEADWTHVGGSLKFMTHARRERARARGHYGKTLVHAMKERHTGKVRANIISSTRRKPLRAEVLSNVAKGTRFYTDESPSYKWAKDFYRHKSVNHQWFYVWNKTHVNGCENFFNCLRRGLKGTYVSASPEHLSAYVDETVWRFNNRKLTDWERFDKAMRLIVGKRLTYSTLTDGAVR